LDFAFSLSPFAEARIRLHDSTRNPTADAVLMLGMLTHVSMTVRCSCQTVGVAAPLPSGIDVDNGCP